MKIATVKYIGTQAGFGTCPDFKLFNITKLSHPSKVLCVGSSVTEKTIRAEGFDMILHVDTVSETLKVGSL